MIRSSLWNCRFPTCIFWLVSPEVEDLMRNMFCKDVSKRLSPSNLSVGKCIWLSRFENILILSGDHLYRMDYMEFVLNHIDRNVDITVSCVHVGESLASEYGLMKIDSKGQVAQFREKPMDVTCNPWEQVEKGLLRVSYISGNDQLADVLTKPLFRSKFIELCSKLGLSERSTILRGNVNE